LGRKEGIYTLLARGLPFPGSGVVVIRAFLRFLVLKVAIDPIGEVHWGSRGLWVGLVKGSEGVGYAFESVGIIVGRVMVGTYLLSLILKPSGEYPTIQNLFHFPFRLGPIDYWCSFFLALT
jgi:hypothetical protein